MPRNSGSSDDTEVMNNKRDWEEGVFRCSDFLLLVFYLQTGIVRALNQIVFLSFSFLLLLKLFCFLLHVWREDVLGVAAMFVCLFGSRVSCVVYAGARRRRLCNSVVYIAAAL